jgi:hypothetical protein
MILDISRSYNNILVIIEWREMSIIGLGEESNDAADEESVLVELANIIGGGREWLDRSSREFSSSVIIVTGN